VVTLLLHISMGVIYDLDSPDPDRNPICVVAEALIWNIVIQGFLQPLAAIFVGLVVCPLISVAILAGMYKIIRYGPPFAKLFSSTNGG